MRIEVHCFATLAPKAPKGNFLEVPQATRVEDVMHQLGLSPDDVKLIFVNGVHHQGQTVLHENDRVAFVPAVGGG